MFRRLQALWVFLGSLLVSGGIGAVHWWTTTPIYESQACLRLRTPTAPELGAEGQLPDPLVAETLRRLRQFDVQLAETDDAAREDLKDNVRCRAGACENGQELTLRFRTTEPDVAVPVLRTVVDCWLERLGRPADKAGDPTAASEAARLEAAVTRQKQHIQTLAGNRKDKPEDPHKLWRDSELLKATLAELRVDVDEARKMRDSMRVLKADTDLAAVVARLPDPVLRSQARELLHRVEQEKTLASQRALQARYEAVYGRKHPRRRAVEEQITQLVARLGEEPADPSAPHVRLQALAETRFKELEGQATGLEDRIAELEALHQQIEERTESLTGARTELSRLERERSEVQARLAATAAPPLAEIVRPPMLLMQPVWPVAWHSIAGSLTGGLMLGVVLVRRRARFA